jgi:hypothetical protein
MLKQVHILPGMPNLAASSLVDKDTESPDKPTNFL